MPTINTIEASYRLYLSRISKQSTRKDYTMRLSQLTGNRFIL